MHRSELNVTTMNVVHVAVIGASGYSGEELVRLLIRHPGIELAGITSRQHAGAPLATIFPRFAGQRYADLAFVDSEISTIVGTRAEVVFIALPHGVAAGFARPLLEAGRRVIDLSADFRIKNPATYEEYYGTAPHAPELAATSVYGLPEVYREQIRTAQLVASPGCYPTSVLLPLLPLVKARLLDNTSIAVTSMSGVSGAGRNAKTDYLFVECNESVRAYSVPKHRHLGEIEQELSCAAGAPVMINFTPHLVPITRGIHTTIYASLARGADAERIATAFEKAYRDEPFVRLLGANGAPDTKHVAGSNFIDIAWRVDPRTGRLILLSAEDNLVKGAAGQAVQCLNIMCGFPETAALL
jgi:N-acetyl-gamma-glutamyl-phosphate reductase